MHVGSPKSGTTGVQDTLWRNRTVLAEHGVHYPADRFDEHFLAALDLQQLSWGGLEDQAVGAVDRLVERVNDTDGTVVLSHEVLAAASAEQAERLLCALDGEVHVVFSARDLARQVPAEWQELVKHRYRVAYAEFLADLTSDTPTRPATAWFWSVQHWPDVLERWGSTLPPEHVHVVTVPRPGADRAVLTDRFWSVFGIDPAWLTDLTPRANVGLDAAAVTALRHLNERLPGDRLASEHFRPLVREAVVHRGMGGRLDKARVTLPPDLVPWAMRLSVEWVERLRRRAYDVVGDLDELLPQPDASPSPWQDPDETSSEELLEAVQQMLDLAVLSAADLFDERRDVREQRDAAAQEAQAHRAELASIRSELESARSELASARSELESARFELESARSELDRLHGDLTQERARADELVWLRQHPVHDVKRRMVDASGTHRGVAVGLDLYRAVRDRNHRRSREGTDIDSG